MGGTGAWSDDERVPTDDHDYPRTRGGESNIAAALTVQGKESSTEVASPLATVTSISRSS